MATDEGKASGGEEGTKGKSSGSQVSVKFDLKWSIISALKALPDYCRALGCTVTHTHTVPVLTCYAVQFCDKTFVLGNTFNL